MVDLAELEALAAEIRAADPSLSEDQALDVAAAELASLAAYTLVWDAQPTNVTTDISAYAANWDKDALAMAAAR